MRLLAAVLLGFIGVYANATEPTPKLGEILPSGAMQKKYGLYCEARPRIRLAAKHVPSELRALIPTAERWGVGDDIIRGDCGDRASQKEKDAFANALRGRTAAVSRWLDSFKDNDSFSEEMAAFMYMLKALDEMGLWPDPPVTSKN